MGAAEFFNHVTTAQAPEDAFHTLVQNASFEHGSGGYTGTIAEKGGEGLLWFTRANFPEEFNGQSSERPFSPFVNSYSTRRTMGQMPRPVTLTQAQVIASNVNLDKWGPTAVLPIIAEDGIKRRTRKITLNLDAEQYKAFTNNRLSFVYLRSLVASSISLSEGESIEDVTAGEVTPTRVVSAEAPSEKTLTKFFVINPNQGMNIRWENGYDAQAQARAAALEKIKTVRPSFGSTEVTLEVVSMTRRVSGAPLVSVTSAASKAKVTLEVSIIKSAATARISGYAFFGTASC